MTLFQILVQIILIKKNINQKVQNRVFKKEIWRYQKTVVQLGHIRW